MSSHSTTNSASESNDFNLVAAWLRFDIRRVIAGGFAGAFAGIVALVFAMVLATKFGYEIWYPVKIAAVPFLGAAAMDYGNMQGLIVGLMVHLALSATLGKIYGHFSIFSEFLPLLALGLVWGVFSWIFISCLFVQAFTEVFALNLSMGAAFFVNMVYGIALSSLTIFNKMLKQ
jgi:hypothetical protein